MGARRALLGGERARPALRLESARRRRAAKLSCRIMAHPRRDLTTLGYRRIIQLLVSLVIVPGVLLSGVGFLLLALGEAQYNLIMGILVLTFCGTLATGVILVWLF